MIPALGWPKAILVSCAVMSVLIVADVDGPLRLAVTLWFLIVCPGMAFAPLLPGVSPLARLGLGIALSLGLDTAVASTMLSIGAFSATGGLFLLELVCLVGCGLQVDRWERRPVAREIRLHG